MRSCLAYHARLIFFFFFKTFTLVFAVHEQMDMHFPSLTFKSKAILSQVVRNLCFPFGDKLRYFLEASTASWPRKTSWELEGMWGFPCGSADNKSTYNAGDLGSIPGLGRSPGEGKRQPTPVFWPGEFHGLYSPWGHKESDTAERLSLEGEMEMCSTLRGTWFRESSSSLLLPVQRATQERNEGVPVSQ